MSDREVVAHRFEPDGPVPNNSRLPLLVYPAAVEIAGADPAAAFERLFDTNRWPPAWRNGVHPFHHYHSTAHEALGIYAGEVTVLFGGEHGIEVTARPGDVVVLPAGVGHKRVATRGRLGVVGAYPAGQHADMCVPKLADGAARSETVASVPIPTCDPVYGREGPLFSHWR